ncbi:MAG: 2,3-bisphosphoglycerate-independent phosphoglycerate mutase [Candidatus Thiodiazotropha lotti]|uniref:2,3-bisphosphoglycerate-independent phosphoglycerate mutase n=1 Tax=Candidatus Thiodiazotropha endoloripes TaxID=1818881 RepID=A0A1E2UMW1_9GAMM|nr:2,3-bisphosphoglycerate-independent phosphoglycerate mutase [Candidatus Thiodiazotropha endoloripes]MCG7900662.1 2,3-bisphosphoglycerate-independent phosphoglycerate mutase [Candidatus Thiodiazotropha weberae]MCG7991434.1 2,3-bisphosphoglycerate-independent phosphoglycerate mutase [Candidatus Thiodiazotropha lotti]MCG7902323.1 2,3-bisphosphoglycerate-independent phosphoglycerate mutase [Candidatus Thiodiazotropha weberae]MCG7912623.1 2,3-bisphosphoglycerate-independent phosphoglycerate mutas
MSDRPKPVVLTILDGWGYSEDTEVNAITEARTPVWDRLWREHPHTLITTAGAAVGLPGGQMGNSEVGHLNLGAGRVVYQEFTRVSRSIRTGSFFTNETLTTAVDKAVENGKTVHLLGLLSPGGVHSHEEHIHAMAKLAVERGAKQVYFHAFLDGRDTPPKSAEASLVALTEVFESLGVGRIASLIGRYFAMDRDNRWERVEQAYNLLVDGKAAYQVEDAISGLQDAYQRGETDEFVASTSVTPPGASPARVEDGDVMLFLNYRADRARQLTKSFVETDFDAFKRERVPALAEFVSLTRYHKQFDIPVAFPPEKLRNVFGEYIAKQGLLQLRLAETEKYAHVTFFFNGGREKPFEGEDRILVPSPQVATYDLKPEMSAEEVTDHLVEAIESGKYDAIICNFANSDMVGHTGKFEAAKLAIETLDHCLGRVLKALHLVDGEMLVTADHGNAEQMEDHINHQPHTAHTTNPVPLVYVGRHNAQLLEGGALCDISPTLLKIMGLSQPDEMKGRSLIEFDEA